jgi:type I restriction enzyme S subunit
MADTKPSGITWIGNIPPDWEMKKIKYISTLKGRIGWQGLTSDEYTDEGAYLITGTDFDNGGINWDTCVHVPMKRWEEAKDIQIVNGDLLITKDGTIGKVAIVDGLNSPCSLNSGVLRISTINGYDRRFLFWVLQSEVFWTWYSNKTAGNSTILHLYQGDFAEFNYAVPPLPEQQAIAAFLDDCCGKVDEIITDSEKQVEILHQYKKALITETVTKGLDKSIPMKDSGIDWIGNMPAHWKLKRIKHGAGVIGSGTTPESGNIDYYDGGIPWIQSGDLYGRDVIIETEKTITPLAVRTYSALRQYSNDFVVVAMYGASVGNVAISKISAYVNQACCVLIPDINNDIRYLYYWLTVCHDDLVRQSFGGGQPNISQQKIKNEHYIQAPLAEQQAIADFLDHKCAEVNSLVADKESSIAVMRQYKKSLIYEYVTGKKRVVS